ncbi:hypothetical protein OsI_02606 [Oryza sativa Indica Group]|uniref:Uncharacterized protein n=1 Tax=Oryza sativa subsp. indica TaxID=39946 RepID=B8AAT3_ORYSI|nr:hypothetical protein OsI_02606 [Oryza sativa Indica Group]
MSNDGGRYTPPTGAKLLLDSIGLEIYCNRTGSPNEVKVDPSGDNDDIKKNGGCPRSEIASGGDGSGSGEWRP